MEDAGRLCKRDYAVNDGLPVEVRNSEQHLRLVINECNCAVVGSQQSFFAALCATVILRQGVSFPFFREIASNKSMSKRSCRGVN
jgi:hypothetical protein